MRISHAALPAVRTAVVLAFIAAMAVVFGYYWTGAGGRVPLVTEQGYQVSFTAPKVNNLVYNSQVTLAGTPVGNVRTVDPLQTGNVKVTMKIDDKAAFPLHRGVTLNLRTKTLVAETFVDIIDGRGKEIPNGGSIPQSAVSPVVKLEDVFRTLGPQQRQQLSGSLKSLSAATAGTQSGIAGAVKGLGDLSREGSTALEALAEQRDSLQQLSANTARVLEALDTRQGQIAQLVGDANQVTQATAGSADDIRQVMRKLPGTLSTARSASDDLSRLAAGLQPVAANLDRGAPFLNQALQQLPATTRDLRGLLPALDQTLIKAPPTLEKVPAASNGLVDLIPQANQGLANLNPMLNYLRPYSPEIVSFFTAFPPVVPSYDGGGPMVPVAPILSEQSVRNFPVNTNRGFLDKNDAYPGAGSQSGSPERNGPGYREVPRAPLNAEGFDGDGR